MTDATYCTPQLKQYGTVAGVAVIPFHEDLGTTRADKKSKNAKGT
jgi:hypothetical protein